MVSVREARPEEFAPLGALLVEAYAALPGFPSPEQNPAYYGNLRHIGALTHKPGVQLLAAQDDLGRLLGGVVYFADLAHYGAGNWGDTLAGWAGFRFLGVGPQTRGTGAGRALTTACIELARQQGKAGLVLHTTRAMPVAWAMYERLGFMPDPALDLRAGTVSVYGFRLALGRAGGGL